MSLQFKPLSGRLPLLTPEILNGDQRKLYDRINATMVPWSDSVGFQSKSEDGGLIGPFNPSLFRPEIASAFLDLQEVEQSLSTLSERVRQVVILAVGAVWKSPYELYAHSAAARHAGFAMAAIRAMAAGEPAEGLSKAERSAYWLAYQLSAEHHVEPALYEMAERNFGARGLVDIVFLVGTYQIVCALLNGFDIPAPERTEQN